MPKWIYDFKKAIHIKDGETILVGEEPFIFTSVPALQTKAGVKKISKSIANQVKLINISEVSIKTTKDGTTIVLPDDVECMEKNYGMNGLVCIQKDFDGSHLKIDLKTQRGLRVTPPPNWRALEIQKAAKGKPLEARKAAFHR